jgi:hypothetical protein
MSLMLFLMLDRGLNKVVQVEKFQNLLEINLEIILKNNSKSTTQA